jgi:hypothetical protein
MDILKFIRKPLFVHAVQVTPDNIDAVAAWCGGTVTQAEYKLMGLAHNMGAILLPKQGRNSDEDQLVKIGHWITKYRSNFRAWTNKAFFAVYLPHPVELKEGDLIRANDGEWDGWEGTVVDPHLIGVDFGARGRVLFQSDQIAKIDKMAMKQLELNAGVDASKGSAGMPVSLLDEMRQASKDQLAAMEAKNLEDTINVGDFVKVLPHASHNEHSKTFIGQHGDVVKSDTVFRVVEFATADPEVPEFVTFLVDALEKVRQDDQVVNLAEESTVTINDLREEIGLPKLEKLGHLPADPRSVQTIREMTPERREEFVAVQKSAEEVMNQRIQNGLFGGNPVSMFDTPPEADNDPVKNLGAVSSIVDGGDTGKYKPRFAKGEIVEVLEGHDYWPTGKKGISMGEVSDGQLAVMIYGKDSPWWFDEDQLRLSAPLEMNDLVKVVGKPSGDIGLVTVVGCDPEGKTEDYIEVLYGENDYQHHLPADLYRVGHKYELPEKSFATDDLVEVVNADNTFVGLKGNVTVTSTDSRSCSVRLDTGLTRSFNFSELKKLESRGPLSIDDMAEVLDSNDVNFGQIGRVVASVGKDENTDSYQHVQLQLADGTYEEFHQKFLKKI